MSLHVLESGTSGSPAVVFLHGVGNSGAMWAGHMAHLAAYHCRAPDLPGFGRSNQLGWRSREDTAEAVAALIHTRVPGATAHVVGLSLGGSVVHTLLETHPELLEHAVIDGAGALPWSGTRLVTLRVALLSPLLHTRLVVDAIARTWGLDEQSMADLRAASPAAFRRGFADANRTRITPGQVWAPCPTLLVAGEGELKPPVRASNAALAALMPQAVARFLPGHGHGWIGREPELHRRIVESWLAGTELPAELGTETTPWSSSMVERMLGP